MQIVVDPKVCTGHGRCHLEAPDLVDLDDNGYAVIVGEGAITAQTLEAAENAVAVCPVQALSIT